MVEALSMRIGLNIRFMAAFVAIAVALMAGAMLYFEQRIEEGFRSDFESRRLSIEATVQQRLGYFNEELRREAEGFSTNSMILEIGQALKERQFWSSDTRPRNAVRDVHELFVSNPGLSVLYVVDMSVRPGVVVGAGHTDFLQLPRPEVLNWHIHSPNDIRMSELRSDPENTEKGDRVLETVVAAGTSLLVVGGQTLTKSWLARLIEGHTDEVRLTLSDANGVFLSIGNRGDGEWDGVDEKSFDSMGLSFSLSVSRRRLTDQIESMRHGMVQIGVVAVLLALLLGWWTARRLTRPIEALAEATRDVASGELIRVLRDERRRDELGDLIRSFNAMSLQIVDAKERAVRAERVAAWRDIARQIAHEIKNPLFPIQTSIETLQKAYDRKMPEFEEILRESTSTILEEVARMERIVNAFSHFARMPKPEMVSLGLNKVCHQVVHLHRSVDEQITVKADLAEELPSVYGDMEQMTQVLTNLVKNGIEATQSKGTGTVRVWTEQRDGEVVFGVDDEGPGIAPEERDKVFAPYMTNKVQGTGLGLAIVLRIVTEHGGRIDIENASTGGASFRVYLPVMGSPEAG
jgi:two-component system nitrogen regulation sensor histidine kinase NtrY